MQLFQRGGRFFPTSGFNLRFTLLNRDSSLPSLRCSAGACFAVKAVVLSDEHLACCVTPARCSEMPGAAAFAVFDVYFALHFVTLSSHTNANGNGIMLRRQHYGRELSNVL